MLRWLGTNLRKLILAFILAMAVWISAVIAADPDETKVFPRPIPLEIIGLDSGLVIVGTVPQQLDVTLRAPKSVWEKLISETDSVQAIVYLSGLDVGRHTVQVQVQISLRPVQLISVSPASFELTLEPLVTRSLPIKLNLLGQPATGYQAGEPKISPLEAVVSGPESVLQRVEQVRASLDLAGVRQDIEVSLPLEVLDQQGNPLTSITVLPQSMHMTLPIVQEGGYRDLAVKVVTHGRPASGYILTSVSPLPPLVTVFSSDPTLITALPGYVETAPLDLTGASADIETHLNLNLPSGISLVGEQTVLVQVSISAIESSVTLDNRPVEVIGLGSGLVAHVSPGKVDVILSGPLPILDTLSPLDFSVVVDVSGLPAGTYQLVPKIEILIQNLHVESILPGTIEVILSAAVLPTP